MSCVIDVSDILHKYKKKINRQTFERFFFYGIENKKEVREGILYFALNKVYSKHVHENWFAIPNVQIQSEMMQEAIPKYKQFYKFVTLNDVPNNSRVIDIDNQVKKELEEQMELLRKENIIMDTKAGIFFKRDRENQLEGIDNQWEKTGDNWTEQIYEILEILERLEKEEPIQYQKYLLLAKQARAINRGDKEEAIRVGELYERLQQKEKEKDDVR